MLVQIKVNRSKLTDHEPTSKNHKVAAETISARGQHDLSYIYWFASIYLVYIHARFVVFRQRSI